MTGPVPQQTAAPDYAEFRRRVHEVARIAVLAALGLLTALWILEELRELILLAVFSLFCGFALEPVVMRLSRYGLPRRRAALVVLLGVATVCMAFVAAVGAVLAQQGGDLWASLPDYLRQAAEQLDERAGIDIDARSVAETASSLGAAAHSLVGGALGLGATLATLVLQLLVVLTLTYYAAADGPQLRRALCSLLPPERQRDVAVVWEIAVDRTARYVYYRTGLAVLSAVAHFVAFTLLDVRFALALALWVGAVSQLIPAVGTYLAGLLPVAVALASSPRTALLLLAFIVVYQQLENYVISPPFSAWTMRIHPAVGFLSALAGLALAGPLGAVLALPVVATVQVVLAEHMKTHLLVVAPSQDEAPAPIVRTADGAFDPGDGALPCVETR